MMQSEFNKILGSHSKPDNEEYAVIEKVYTFHPAINDKVHMAELFTSFGMLAIRDLLPRAEKVEQKEAEIQKQAKVLEVLRNELLDIEHPPR